MGTIQYFLARPQQPLERCALNHQALHSSLGHHAGSSGIVVQKRQLPKVATFWKFSNFGFGLTGACALAHGALA